MVRLIPYSVSLFKFSLVTRIMVAMLLFSLVSTIAIAQQIQPDAIAQIQALLNEKALRTPAQKKISSRLLLSIKRQRRDVLFNAIPALRTNVEFDADRRTLVDIKANVTGAVLAQIQALGGDLISSFPKYQAIRALIPLNQIEPLAALPDVISIRPADRAITNKNNTSEGDVAHRADLARTTFSVDGTGVKIGVLSDGVDTLADRQATGDLPSVVTVLSGQAGSGDEGTAMLEIVHDLAPGAELFFATAFSGQAQFAQNILDLNAAGCDVIVDDVFYFSEPVFQDGTIAQAVNTVTASNPSAGGSLYFSSAGNSGNLNDGTAGVWEGDFVPIAAPSIVGGTAHDFGGGTNYNTITKDSPSYFILQWADPSGGSANDYDLFLLNPARTTVYDSSTNVQDGNDDPFEYIDSGAWNDLNNTLVVIQSAGADRYLHLNTNRGRLAIATDGQTSGHAAAADCFGVAAVSAAGSTTPFNGTESVETFSSDGPRKIFYEADGTPITPGNFLSTGGTVRQKPDIAAADGVQTDTPGFNPFYGTSAAAPHAAAIAGLLLDAELTLTQAEVRNVLTGTALDIEGTGVDRDSGSGIVDAYNAVRVVVGTTISADATGNPKDNFNPQEHVYGRTTGLSLTSGTYDLYVVATKIWTLDENQTIPARISGTGSDPETTIEVNIGNIQKSGGISEDIWVNPPVSETAQYDIVVDINGNGKYDPLVDLLDYKNGIGYGFSLPVELSTFTATSEDGVATLFWRTETEVNNVGFAIYRSEEKDGEYTKIDFVPGSGNSAMPIDYQFTDKTAEASKTYFYYLEDIDIQGEKNSSKTIKVVVSPAKFIPKEFRLLQNYPNPFNPETWIPYNLAADVSVSIYIYNIQGHLIRHLDIGKQKAGSYVTKDTSAYWNGRDEHGEKIASGVYWYMLRAGEFRATRRMVIVK